MTSMEGGYFDGYASIRIRNVEELRRDTSFHPDFATTQPEWPPILPTIDGNLDLDSTRGMLCSLLRKNHLIGIERDKRVDAIWIGVTNELAKRWLEMPRQVGGLVGTRSRGHELKAPLYRVGR